MAELCRRVGVSRQTGYVWVKRFHEGGHGVRAMEERSRRPLSSLTVIELDVQDLVVAARKLHPRWGSRKLRAWLLHRYPGSCFPSASRRRTAGSSALIGPLKKSLRHCRKRLCATARSRPVAPRNTMRSAPTRHLCARSRSAGTRARVRRSRLVCGKAGVRRDGELTQRRRSLARDLLERIGDGVDAGAELQHALLQFGRTGSGTSGAHADELGGEAIQRVEQAGVLGLQAIGPEVQQLARRAPLRRARHRSNPG